MLRLYDTRTGNAEPVGGSRHGHLRIYTCGPATYRRAHIGDLRDYLLPDLIRRTAELAGFRVMVCQNVADIGHPGGDPGGIGAAADVASQAHAARGHEDAFQSDLAALNVRPAEHSPRASESIPIMIEMISKLIDSKDAYVAADGTVFFDAGSAAGCALWMGNGARSVRTWAAPWGRGLPAAHTQCAAMSLHHLGDVIDIHTGGIDLPFPHSYYERALSNTVTGHEVVQCWAHAESVLFEGREVAAVAANTVRLADIAAGEFDPLALRLAFLGRHYREQMDLSWREIEVADAALRRWRARVAAWACEPSAPMSRPHVKAVFAAAQDDLDTPGALAELREMEADTMVSPGAKFETFAYLDRLLGLDLARDVGKPVADLAGH